MGYKFFEVNEIKEGTVNKTKNKPVTAKPKFFLFNLSSRQVSAIKMSSAKRNLSQEKSKTLSFFNAIKFQ
jgi:hypothetical protein